MFSFASKKCELFGEGGGWEEKKKAKSSLENCQCTKFLSISSTTEILCPLLSEKGLIITTVNIHTYHLILFLYKYHALINCTIRAPHLLLIDTGNTFCSHCQDREMESLSDFVVCLSYQWLWNTQWASTALEYKSASHNTQLLPFPQQPLKFYLKIPTGILLSYYLFTLRLGNISSVSCLNST